MIWEGLDWLDGCKKTENVKNNKIKKLIFSGVNKILGFFGECNFFVLINLEGGLCCMCIMVISWAGGGGVGVAAIIMQSSIGVSSHLLPHSRSLAYRRPRGFSPLHSKLSLNNVCV